MSRRNNLISTSALLLVGLPIARALGAYEGKDFEVAVDELQRVRGHARRFGGSHAQRDLLQRAHASEAES